MGTLTLYFDGYNASEAFSTSPGNGVDGSTATFAASTTDNQVENLNSLSDFDAIFGAITKVELRGHGYKSGGVQASYLHFRPVFAAGDGPNQSYTLGTSGAWSSYFDITAVTNAPSTWQWTDIVALGCDVVAKPSTGRTVYFSRVEILVTYDDLVVPSSGFLFGGAPATIDASSGGGTSTTVASQGAGLLLGGSAASVLGERTTSIAGPGSGLQLGSTPATVQAVRTTTVTALGGGLLLGSAPGQITTTSGSGTTVVSPSGGLLLGATPGEVAADRQTSVTAAGGGLVFGATRATIRARTVPRGGAGAPGLGALGGRHAPDAPGLGYGGRAGQVASPGVGWTGRRGVQAAGLGWAGVERPQSTQMGSW